MSIDGGTNKCAGTGTNERTKERRHERRHTLKAWRNELLTTKVRTKARRHEQTNKWTNEWTETGSTNEVKKKYWGESNYLEQTCQRIEEHFCGGKMKLWLLETARRKNIAVLTDGGRGMVLDEVNELLNAWLKRPPWTEYLSNVVRRSAHLIFGRKAMQEHFGKKKSNSSGSMSKGSTTRSSPMNQSLLAFRMSNLWQMVNWMQRTMIEISQQSVVYRAVTTILLMELS